MSSYNQILLSKTGIQIFEFFPLWIKSLVNFKAKLARFSTKFEI